MRGNTGKVQTMRVKDPLGGDFPRERAHARGCFPSLSMDGADADNGGGTKRPLASAHCGLRVAQPQPELTDLRYGGKYLSCQFA